jgi:hypothetical protein
MIPRTPALERYTRFSCPNPQCAQFNRPGEGNIAHRSWTGKAKHSERLHCTVCGREFSERAGTLMARSKLPEITVERLLKCQRWGVCDEGTADICAVDLKTVHRFQRVAAGSVTKRLLSSTASKAHGSSSWHGMDCEFAHRLHLLEDSATSLLLVSCTHRCSGQGCTETFLLRFRPPLSPGSVAREQSSSRQPAISRSRRCRRQQTSRSKRGVASIPTPPAAIEHSRATCTHS